MKFSLRGALTVLVPFWAAAFLLLSPAAQAQTLPAPTPTIDRLAKPTLPANPSQADQGAQDYWLYCSPCHGDRAQGLTDEFRQQYPPEHQNCWKAGCHGRRPYPNGWTIPTPVPALVGPQALTHFADASALFGYMRLAMPFQTPGILEDETYWRITAFLLRQNGYRSDNTPLDASNASAVRIPRPTPSPAPVTQTPLPQATPLAQPVSPTQFFPWLLSLALSGLLLFFLFALLKRK